MRFAPTRAAAGMALLILAAAPPAFAVGTPAGTVISNQATVNYTDTNGNPLTALSNVVTTTVSQVASVTVAPDGAASATPGDTVFYAHAVTNGGNGDDTIDMAAASSNGWITALFLDNNGNGIFDAGDTPMSDTDGDAVPDTGLMAANAVVRIIVSVAVPGGTPAGTVDSLVVTGTSTFDVGVSETATDTTTVLAPDLAAVKSVAPIGSQPPGAVLTYTIVVTNGGNGTANGVTLTDPIPANTTYVPGSMTLNAASLTDAGGDDEGDFNTTTPGAVTVSVGSLAAAGTATITFQVTIN